ncbi:BAG family molecular chaperone regulator 4-like, partial [Trifolium medium]|nr:BAG family molecular chaperone regulator 4-like [Trifolium medium]
NWEMIMLIIGIFQVATLEAAINAGNKTPEKEFLVWTELLMSQLLKLDGIVAEGEAKLQRKAEISEIKSLIKLSIILTDEV